MGLVMWFGVCAVLLGCLALGLALGPECRPEFVRGCGMLPRVGELHPRSPYAHGHQRRPVPYARIAFGWARRSGSAILPPDFTRHVWTPGFGADRRHSEH